MKRRRQITYGVHLLVGARGTEAVETELLVRVALPAHGAEGLDGEHGNAVGQDGEAVGLVLDVEYLEAGNRDDTGGNAVLLLKVLGSLNTDADLGTGGDDSNGGVGGVDSDVTTLHGTVNAGQLQLGQVLTGQGQDTRGVLGSKSHVVGSTGLVAISGAPNHAVGQSTEVSQSLNRLMSRAVLTQTDGVMSSDVDDTDAGQGRQAEGTGGV